MFEHEFSKYEIVTYLREYNKLMLYSTVNRKDKFFDSFKKLMRRDKKAQYAIVSHYNEMVDIYEIVLLTRYLTILYDNYFEYLLNENIENINIPDDILLVNKKYTKKEIITNLRNAFNNVDNPKRDSFRLIRVDEDSKSKIKLEVLYMVDNMPFHAILDADILKDICYGINDINKISLAHIQALKVKNKQFKPSDIAIRTYYFGENMYKANRNIIIEKLNNNKDKPCELLFLENGLSYDEYSYNDKQYNKVLEDLQVWGNKNVSGYEVQDHLLKKVMPLSCLKEKSILMNLILTDKYVKEYDKSYHDIVDEATKIAILKRVDEESPLYPYANTYESDRQIMYELFDYENILSITNSIYYEYLFGNLIEENYVKFTNSNIADKEKVIKAFSNMHWYKGEKEAFVLYDWDKNYNKPTINMEIDFEKMEKCADLYYQYAIYFMPEDNKFMDIPIHFMVEKQIDGSNKKIGISCIKNNKYYFYNMFKEYLVVCGETQRQRYANKEELEFFLNELNNLSIEEKQDNDELLQEIKNVLEESIELEEQDKKHL